ncbi:MAG TPA: hypothetical protein VGM08_02955 [Candidatus Saccharimonadales bacterium]|jgi:hypothetical protein
MHKEFSKGLGARFYTPEDINELGPEALAVLGAAYYTPGAYGSDVSETMDYLAQVRRRDLPRLSMDRVIYPGDPNARAEGFRTQANVFVSVAAPILVMETVEFLRAQAQSSN